MTFTREQIIAWARQAGIEVHPGKQQIRHGSAVWTGDDSTEQLVRLTAIVEQAVRADENEQCAKLVDLEAKLLGQPLRSADAIRARRDA